MARLKLHTNLEESRRQQNVNTEKTFLLELVKQARKANKHATEPSVRSAISKPPSATGRFLLDSARRNSMMIRPHTSPADLGNTTDLAAPNKRTAARTTLPPAMWITALRDREKSMLGLGSQSAREHRPVTAPSRTSGTYTSEKRTPPVMMGILSMAKRDVVSAPSRRSPLALPPYHDGGDNKDGSLDRSVSPSIAREPEPAPFLRRDVPDVPDWFRDDGVPPTMTGEFFPEYRLWVTLHGGNGTWQKTMAKAEWERQVDEHQDAKKEWALREERERKRAAEAEKRRKQEQEEEMRRAQEAEAERQRRREEEQRKIEEAERQRRLRLEDEERMRRRKLPRPCHNCNGTGNCKGCDGNGFTTTLFLAPRVADSKSPLTSNVRASNDVKRSCGLLPKGCEICGGWGDGATWGEYNSGTGKCIVCKGAGKLQAPAGGWPTDAPDVHSGAPAVQTDLLQQRRPSSRAAAKSK